MNQLDTDKSYDTAVKVISAAAALPIIKVDRQQFLTQQFGKSDQLALILANGPQAVYSVDELKQRAQLLVKNSTNKTAFTSFVTGLPSNPLTMAFAGGADVVQYFGFALNLAQQIAYLFGEDEILTGKADNLSDEVKGRLIVYLGVMFGVGGAAATLNKVSNKAGSVLGKKVASQALTHTTWYPLIKQIGKIIGIKVTKKTVEKTITKVVPVIGGVISGGLTYLSYRPMGNRLVDAFVKNINGEFDNIATEKIVIDGEFVEIN